MTQAKKYPLAKRISVGLIAFGVVLAGAFFAISALPGWVLAAAFVIVLAGAFGLGPLEFVFELIVTLLSS